MRKFKKSLSIFMVIMLCFSLLPNTAIASDGIQVTGLSSNDEAVNLVNALLGGGVDFSNVKFLGKALNSDPNDEEPYASAGTFIGGTGIFGFESGIVLSTGDIKNIIGPNVFGGIGTDIYLPGDADLEELIDGEITNDATVLEFDFVPNTDEITFQYQFASDEYNEYVGKFNDVFGFFVNGENIALIPGTDTVVSINNINLKKNSNYYINNDIDEVDPELLLNTEMDGLTVTLTAKANVNKDENNHIKLAIADALDYAYDSVVLIKAGSFVSDNTSPILTIPNDKTVFATGEKTTVDIGTATATDDTTPDEDIIITNNAPLDGFEIGTTDVVWTATDLSGNSTSLTQKIRVIDPDDSIEINVWKNWHGMEVPSLMSIQNYYTDKPEVIINLIANGEKIDQSVTLNNENEWSHTFIAPKYDDKFEEIKYTIEEEPVDNYVSVIEWYDGEGYAVNNIPCIDIPVTKVWNGPVGEEATVALYADGEETDYSLKLNQENQWKNIFKIPLINLQTFEPIEYIDNIEFTVKEIEQVNYDTVVAGDMYNGFTVTNTYNGPIEGYDYAVINWMYETGYNTEKYNLKYTLTTSASAITGEDIEYYKNLHYDSGYTFVSSNVKSEMFVVTIGETTSGTAITGSAIKTTATLRYEKNYSGGGGKSSDTTRDKEVPKAELEKLNHFAYIIGYHEGDVRPLKNITREEVAMIFYRLLTDKSRNEFISNMNSFTDLDNQRWSSRAISTLHNAGILSGYPDGTFRPSDSITRAEFATIAAKFDKLETGNTSKFTDIQGHWAEKYIISSEIKGWIKGYPDMTFRPEQDITRAEAMTLINNVLGRAVPEENIHSDAIFWPDISEDDWYYEAVMEATNSHDYVYEDNGDELWTDIKPNKVWP